MPTMSRKPNSVSSIIIAYRVSKRGKKRIQIILPLYAGEQAVAVILAAKQKFLLDVG